MGKQITIYNLQFYKKLQFTEFINMTKWFLEKGKSKLIRDLHRPLIGAGVVTGSAGLAVEPTKMVSVSYCN